MQTSSEPEYDYERWLMVASNGIERGMNANAIWRLHERIARIQHYDSKYELGGEA